MRIMSDKKIRNLILIQAASVLLLAAACEVYMYVSYCRFSAPLLVITLIFGAAILSAAWRFFRIQDRELEAASENIRSFLGGGRDKRLECCEDGELYRLFHEINIMASVQNAQTEREKSTNEFLKRTVFDISHQLKTPLAAMNIYNGLIAEADSPEAVKRFSDSIECELDRMESLIKKMLTLTRLDSGAVIFEKTVCSVSEMLEDIAGRFAARAGSENKTVELSGSADDTLRCDRGWLSEALANIIQNGLDHTQAGGIIKVSWVTSGNMLTIRIKDNGCGIPPEDIDSIFKRFYRSRSSADRQGIGLGLPLAKSIIEAHDGTILVDSRPGQGTLFTVNFLIPAKK